MRSLLINRNVLAVTSFTLLFGLSSCGSDTVTNNNQGDTAKTALAAVGESERCIDNKPPATPFSTDINGLVHDLPLNEALAMTDKLSTMRDSMLIASLRGKNVIPISETFNLAALDEILCQPNTVAIRSYLGMDNENKLRIIFVGVNPNGEDIISSKGTVVDNPKIAEKGQRYP